MLVEVEERREILHLTGRMPGIWELGVRLAKFVEKRVDHGVDSAQSLSRSVLEQFSYQVDGIRIGLAEDLVEGMRLDLGELVLHIVRVHGPNLLSRRGTQHLDDFDQLVDTRLAGEERLAQHQFGHDTSRRPHIYIHTLISEVQSRQRGVLLPILVV